MMLNPCAYRSLFRSLGSRIRLWHAIPATAYVPPDGYDMLHAAELPGTPEGFFFVEDLAAREVRVAIETVRTTQLHPQIGWLLQGEILLTHLPDEVNIRNYDRVLLLDWELNAVDVLSRGGEEGDVLVQPWAKAVDEVRQDETVYTEGWKLDVDEERGVSRIIWAPEANQPAAGDYYQVFYRYRPLFWASMREEVAGRPTPMGIYLPRSVRLTRERPANEVSAL